jgi:putative hydrolase of the HAD superfamily
MANSRCKVLFTDVGGVIATNGWDTELRAGMVHHFGLHGKEVDSRHRLMFDSYERGKLSLEEYLRWTVFYEPRSFSVHEVKQWMFEQGRLLPGTFELYRRVKAKNGVKLALISNEGEGLTQDRVERFGLGDLADYMVFSHAVELRKPDPGIWALGLSLAQVSACESIYIDDRKVFVDFAAHLGFDAHHHVCTDDTARFLASRGLPAE